MFSQSKKRRAIACAGIIAVSASLHKKRIRSKWVKNWLLRRDDFSHMSLLRELRVNDPNDFRNYLRMDENTFNHLLNLVGERLTKQNSVMRQAIPPEERLIATLRFLATGRSYEDLKFSTCIAAQTLGQLIPETCQVIYNVLKEKYMKLDGRIHAADFKLSAGGVGRNIAEAVGKLGGRPLLISTVGEDSNGDYLCSLLSKSAQKYVKKLQNDTTAQCIVVFDSKGECKMLLGNMEVHAKITPEMIFNYESVISKCPLVVLDGNLSVASLDAALKIAGKHQIPGHCCFYEKEVEEQTL